MEFAEPEIAEVLSGRKSFKSTAKSVGKQSLKKQLGSGSKQRRVVPTICSKQASLSRGDILKIISRYSFQTIFDTNFFWGVSVNLGGKVPVKDIVLWSHEQEDCLSTSLNDNCMEFAFPADRKYSASNQGQTFFLHAYWQPQR